MTNEIVLFYPLSNTESMKVTLRTENGVCNYVRHDKVARTQKVSAWVNDSLRFEEQAIVLAAPQVNEYGP